MNMMWDDGDDELIAQDLRRAVGDVEFDYPALVAGVHQRVGRIRRRRAIVTGATVALVGPALVGGSALVLPGILPGEPGTPLAPAASSDAVTETRPDLTVVPEDPTVATADPPAAQQPPWQDSAPPLPEGGMESSLDPKNDWEIPDARPTGITYLDELGTPDQGMNYSRTVPVPGLMTCDPGRAGGVEPLAGQSFVLYPNHGPDQFVEIQVTGWADSQAALDGLRDDAYTWCSWNAPEDRTAVEWPGDEGDEGDEGEEGHLLYVVPESSASDGPLTDTQRAAAVVRQGDYLVAVAVKDPSGEPMTDVAAEIAGKTADNLEVLDPVHGRD